MTPLIVFLSCCVVFILAYLSFIIAICYFVSDEAFQKKRFWYWVKAILMCDNDIEG